MSTHRKIVGKDKRYEPRIIVSNRHNSVLDAEWQNASEDGESIYTTYDAALRSGLDYVEQQHSDHGFDLAEAMQWLYIAEVTTKALLPSKDEIDKILKETVE